MSAEKEKHYAFPFEITSAKTDHIKRKMFDISYADLSPAQKLDIYWPEKGDGPFPVIVSIHGGAFMGGDKRDVQITSMLKALKRGYCVVGINYRMSGEAKFPKLIHDVKAAIRWIRANAELHLFDPDKIATWGGSAGGYQSLMAGVSTHVPELDDLSLGNPNQLCDVQAVVAWFPPTDFLKMDEQLADSDMAPPEEFSHSGSNSPEPLLLGNKITLIPDLVRSANPETYIHADGPPFFTQHATKDKIGLHQQYISDTFAARRAELTRRFKDEADDYFLHECDEEMLADELEERDYYKEVNVFWVPEAARWEQLRAAAKQTDIGKRIDGALTVIEQENPKLKGILDKRYGRAQLPDGKLGELVDLVSTLGFGDDPGAARDVLGQVYEYFLGQFASAEGKKGGQFYTPASIVKTLVAVHAPHHGKVYDPCCGSGGMFVSSEKFIEVHRGKLGNISNYGQE